ncbi:MAG: hypothetical protein DHS20C19_21440 [Acidimicrobiales bacterium]|nr:MAG: hypothetical protein DHS20C19_21440 [Acidimicrobiales bacterium]
MVLVAVGIASAWAWIENRPVEDLTLTSSTTTTTTTTTVPPPTTVDQDARNLEICNDARALVDEVALLPSDAGPGPVAELALVFWQRAEALSTGAARAEMSAVVTYYEDYLETAAPFDFSTTKIILEGDKEKLQQLLTRPAPGLAESRQVIGFGCGVDVPTQPSMRASDFEDLEDRLLDPDDDD